MSTWESCYSDWERVLSNTLSVVQPTTHTMQSPLKALFTLGPFHAPKLHSPYTLNPKPKVFASEFPERWPCPGSTDFGGCILASRGFRVGAEVV